VQKYPVRASHRTRLSGETLATLLEAHIGPAQRSGERPSAKFGAIASLTVWAEGKELAVEVVMDPKVETSVAAETIQRYNRFLEEATGYSSKERASRLRKSAGKGSEKE
jgi:hypothetical protein